MKKIFDFLRSMRFGMLLLILVLLLSVAGSVVPQGNNASWYVQNYPKTHFLILATGAHHLFSTWYFVTLLALLCGNLILCSLARFGRVWQQYLHQTELAQAARPTRPLDAAEREKLLAFLRTRGFRRTTEGEAEVYAQNRFGFFGSFLMHLSILLVFVLGALVLYLARVEDHTIKPGETYTLSDGTALTVNSFRIEDGSGRLDFTSSVTVTGADGTVDGPVEIKVNQPHAFRNHKFYQQTYGTCGSVTVYDTEIGQSEDFLLDEVCFLTADGRNGIWYETLYAGYLTDEDGNYTLIANTSGEYADPVYQVLIAADGVNTAVLAFPGETLTIGSLQYTFNDPVSYPGIRIKTTPAVFTALLYAAFVLMIAALWLSFFAVPAAVCVRSDSYTLYGQRLPGLTLSLNALLPPVEIPAESSETEKADAVSDPVCKE